eukprot:4785102-Pleurochrysis_carterae.AAC.1
MGKQKYMGMCPSVPATRAYKYMRGCCGKHGDLVFTEESLQGVFENELGTCHGGLDAPVKAVSKTFTSTFASA